MTGKRSSRPAGIRVLQFAAFLSLLSAACTSDETTGPESVVCPAGQWAIDTGNHRAWPHDCEPYVADHFTIYSDGSSSAAKATLAGIAEGIFTQLSQEFEIESDAELGFMPGYTYYIYALKDITPLIAAGYRNGFIVAAVDSPPRPNERRPTFYRYLVKHEMTHVFQFTLTDCPSNSACPYWLDVWFREGQAVFMGDYFAIPTLEEWRTWMTDPTHINPILIRRWQDFPDPDRAGQYYPMFLLAYAYLMDGARGHGASIGDMRDLFRYMDEGDPFTIAFERALGISISYFEQNFYQIIEEYLE